MFKLNLKIAWRNLLKNKVYAAINIGGLALGLAGFIFILLYVNYERSYDHWNSELKNIYQVQEVDHWLIKEGKKEWSDETDLRLDGLLKTSMPQIIALTSYNISYEKQSILIGGNEPFLQDGISVATSDFFEVFPYNFIYGDALHSLKKPNSLVITDDFAKKHFGNINPVGKIIEINEANFTTPEPFIITGVIEEPKTPSSFKFKMILKSKRMERISDEFNSYANIYVKITNKQPASELNEIAQNLYKPFKSALLKRQKLNVGEFTVNGIQPEIRLMPFQELHQKPLSGKSWLSSIKPIILLSFLLLIISIINFINMFTAQAMSRAKEVGVKKVIGVNRKSLIVQFLMETSIQCIAAMLLSIIILEGFLPALNQLFELSLSFAFTAQNTQILLQLFLLIVVVTLFAGIYPSLFLSAYQPQDVLKGNFSQGESGKFIRTFLVGLQFVIAIGFFIGILIIRKQVHFMESKDPGFVATSILHIKSSSAKRIDNRFKEIDGVEYVGSSNGVIGYYQDITGKYKYKNETRELITNFVNLEGLQSIGARLLAGRLFDSKYVQDSINTVIINETLSKSFGGNMVGKFLYVNDSLNVQVVGVVKDIRVRGFEDLVAPVVYTAAKYNATDYPNSGGANYLIRFDVKKEKKVIAGIDKIWKSLYPSYPLQYTFMQDDLDKKLVEHKRFMSMVELFSILSISLSLIGLFALAAFLTKQRTKEIAIRKILGADHKQIFFLLNKGYFFMVIIANVISWPIIYLATTSWLKTFAYRIDMPLLPFIIAFIVSIMITIITVSIQVRNAVLANPVKALKYE